MRNAHSNNGDPEQSTRTRRAVPWFRSCDLRLRCSSATTWAGRTGVLCLGQRLGRGLWRGASAFCHGSPSFCLPGSPSSLGSGSRLLRAALPVMVHRFGVRLQCFCGPPRSHQPGCCSLDRLLAAGLLCVLLLAGARAGCHCRAMHRWPTITQRLGQCETIATCGTACCPGLFGKQHWWGSPEELVAATASPRTSHSMGLLLACAAASRSSCSCVLVGCSLASRRYAQPRTCTLTILTQCARRLSAAAQHLQMKSDTRTEPRASTCCACMTGLPAFLMHHCACARVYATLPGSGWASS